MRDTNLMQQALGLTPPWTVVRSDFDTEAGRLDVEIDFTPGRRFAPSVPMTMRHRPPASLDLGTGERHRGYAQHRWPNRPEECGWP
jgi:hypothetical protein